MADIFISYAREDRERARVLANALEDHGWTVWWDPQIPLGKTFDQVIETALDEAKKKAATEYPERLRLDGRKVLHWNDGSVKILDKKISSVNFKKLNELAETENCSVDQLISD